MPPRKTVRRAKIEAVAGSSAQDAQEPLDAPEAPAMPTVHIRANVGILDLLWGEEAVVERTSEIEALLANGLIEEVVDDRD